MSKYKKLSTPHAALTDEEIFMRSVISERIISKLDKISRLNNQEENLVNIVVDMTCDELAKEKAK